MSVTPVSYGHYLVGEIVVDEKGASFIYADRWLATRSAFALSLTMPLSRARYEADVLVPWLSNLLPEALALKVVSGRLGVAPGDVVGMLRHIGQDTAGALSIGPPSSASQPDYRPVGDQADLERLIEELPAKPFLVGEAGVSMSLAGVQDKLPLALLDGVLAIPVNGAPSTHILKPDARERLFGSVHNEALCLVLAEMVGLKAAQVTTGRAGARSYLLVTRYDRVSAGDRKWHRLHQEDFCQALGKPPTAKYEHNHSGIKGPGIADLLGLMDRPGGAGDKLRLFAAIVFNVLICNTDSHAKNYSLYLRPEGPVLTPLYDLMCAACWDVTQNLPQDIAGKNRGAYIYCRHWQRMAQQCGLNPTASLREIEALAGRVIGKLASAVSRVEEMPAGGHPMLKDFAAAIETRCRLVLRNLRTAD